MIGLKLLTKLPALYYRSYYIPK